MRTSRLQFLSFRNAFSRWRQCEKLAQRAAKPGEIFHIFSVIDIHIFQEFLRCSLHSNNFKTIDGGRKTKAVTFCSYSLLTVHKKISQTKQSSSFIIPWFASYFQTNILPLLCRGEVFSHYHVYVYLTLCR